MATHETGKLAIWVIEREQMNEGRHLLRDALTAERGATVERIREQLGEATPRGSIGVDWLVLLRVLDEEVARDTWLEQDQMPPT